MKKKKRKKNYIVIGCLAPDHETSDFNHIFLRPKMSGRVLVFDKQFSEGRVAVQCSLESQAGCTIKAVENEEGKQGKIWFFAMTAIELMLKLCYDMLISTVSLPHAGTDVRIKANVICYFLFSSNLIIIFHVFTLRKF